MQRTGCVSSQAMERTWNWLAEVPEEAAELAYLLFEAAPRLGVAASSPRALRHPKPRRMSYDATSDAARLAAAAPMPSGLFSICLPCRGAFQT